MIIKLTKEFLEEMGKHIHDCGDACHGDCSHLMRCEEIARIIHDGRIPGTGSFEALCRMVVRG